MTEREYCQTVATEWMHSVGSIEGEDYMTTSLTALIAQERAAARVDALAAAARTKCEGCRHSVPLTYAVHNVAGTGVTLRLHFGIGLDGRFQSGTCDANDIRALEVAR